MDSIDIIALLHSQAKKQIAIYQQAYMRDQFPFLGIRKPAIKNLLKTVVRVLAMTIL